MLKDMEKGDKEREEKDEKLPPFQRGGRSQKKILLLQIDYYLPCSFDLYKAESPEMKA